jgi:ribonuclease HIII
MENGTQMSNNKQQTAVEWYDNQLRKVFSNTTEASNFSHEELLQQAKEMEKERMIQFCIDWFISREMNIREYYEQTYGGTKQ